MNPYAILAILAIVVIAILALAVRFLRQEVRARRQASTTARRAGPASEYYASTLRQAAELLGGEENLANALKVSPEALRPWLKGEEPPPIEVHLATLDLLTREAERE